MRLLEILPKGGFRLTENLIDNDIPPYAILSHRWDQDDQEVTFDDMIKGFGPNKSGFEKIEFCGEQAKNDGLQYFWMDSCCIDKSNLSEHKSAINSMFRWYQRATKCYVYLSDVSTKKRDDNEENTWERAFQTSEWFKRGWTLQELLAPESVEFFSRNRTRLGDKRSLQKQIHEITAINIRALQGEPLSHFSVNERFSWIERRKTTIEEDKAYSLLGIFDVSIPIRYTEGMVNAFKRLEDEIDKQTKCIQDLRITNPRDDKKRIEDTKGGLLADSYHWILGNSDFQKWQKDPQSQMLWIKGEPGKGKTMLLCGIVDELKKSSTTHLISFFFCQATDSRINSATAVLRGLLYLLIEQQPSLISHIQTQHNYAGKGLFEDANSWVTLSDIFTSVLQDSSLKSTYLIIDALDECTIGEEKLLEFIAQKSSLCPHVKWLVSSRNWPLIEERLNDAKSKVNLSLELNSEFVSAAVSSYIHYKVGNLTQKKKYDCKTRAAVLDHLSSNANDTFLWVALACQSLEKIPRWNVCAKLSTFPPGLDTLYERMMGQICSSESSELCKQILALITTVYKPITLFELPLLVETLGDISDDIESLQDIVNLCGSFLTIRNDTIYFVHQSAKDYLEKSSEVFPHGMSDSHYEIFSRSLEGMSRTLRRNIYSLGRSGIPIEMVKQPDPDPLRAVRYSCIYWVDHLCEWPPHLSTNHNVHFQEGGKLHLFMTKYYLYWLEALSLCKSMPKGLLAMAKLQNLFQKRAGDSALLEIIYDAHRFFMCHKQGIECCPLQAYTSALIFSPTSSPIRYHFKKEEPTWMTVTPAIDKWSACLQTLEGHNGKIESVVFSHNSTQLASASSNRTIRIWDTSSGECIQVLKGHDSYTSSVAFSKDSTKIASASHDGKVRLWNTSSGKCLRTLEGHSGRVASVVFSHDSTQLASASGDGTIRMWDADSGKCIRILQSDKELFTSVAFSHDSARLASSSDNFTVEIWDAKSGNCLQKLVGHTCRVKSVVFSHDSTRLASASGSISGGGMIRIWDSRSSKCLQEFGGGADEICSVVFSHDSTCLASASMDGKVRVWDTNNSRCIQEFKGHAGPTYSVAFSHDSTQLASSSYDGMVKIWDTSTSQYSQKLDGHSGRVTSVIFSRDSTRLASASGDKTVRIWDTDSGERLGELRGHSYWANPIVFSQDSTRLASVSDEGTIRIWDANNCSLLQELEGHSGEVISVDFSDDSAQLASASKDGTVRMWDVGSGKCIRVLQGHKELTRSVAFSPDWKLLASAPRRPVVRIWDVDSGKCLQTLEINSGNSNSEYSVAFSHDSAKLASASEDGTVTMWDTNSGECLGELKNHIRRVRSVVFSHESTWLASNDSTIRIWDAGSGKCLKIIEVPSSMFYSTTFSHDSSRLASLSEGGVVKIWDTESGECMQTLEASGSDFSSIAVSHDSTRLASGLYDGRIRIWEIGSGKCLQTLEGHSRSIGSIAFSHDSTQLASASHDSTIRIWDISSGECLRKLKGHSSWISSITFSHDSTRLASASHESTVRVWEASTSKCLQEFKGHNHSISSVAFSHDSTQLASASSDGTAMIWDAGSGRCLQTLDFNKSLHNISFGATDLYLHTDIGTVAIGPQSTLHTAQVTSEREVPQYLGVGLSADGNWITRNSEQLIWLPPDYRPSCSAVSGNLIAIGCQSGIVWMCNLEAADSAKC